MSPGTETQAVIALTQGRRLTHHVVWLDRSKRLSTFVPVVTQRLTLRRFTPADGELAFRLYGDERVMHFIGGPLDREACAALFQTRVLDYYAQNAGLGIFATLERASGACVGVHLLNHIQGESLVQVGYLLYPEFWGCGYATEMAKGLLAYGYRTLGLEQIVGIVDLPNLASQRVLAKAGLRRNGERAFSHPAYASLGPLAWFESERDSWLATHDHRQVAP